jgi:hypothetical protein
MEIRAMSNILSRVEFFAKIGLTNGLTDKQRETLYENYRIKMAYERYWSPTCTKEQMARNIAYALELPESTINSRIYQMAKAGVQFKRLSRKSRNGSTINLTVEAFNAIAAMEQMDNAPKTEESELPVVKV